ncbi:TlpA family protein disulfide reductase [Halogeometricum limi]|uniref:TlpA family protein disulfide reductase n=1 Tax=Halogeometricum limi TaxID=555875 RepID=UPI000B7DB03F|nr:TlpA disulfide reductase family protein [Halogeometricum limi]
MKRRELLAGVAGLGVVGGAGYVALEGVGLGDDGLPLQVTTLDAPGSEAGQRPVPVPGSPTVLDLFATWCVPCSAQMESLTSLHEEFGDRVAFVSVTNERFGGGLTEADVRRWWVDHDGAWTLGHDPESRLMRELQAGGLPYLAVVDADGTVTWTHRGLASEASLRERIRAVL